MLISLSFFFFCHPRSGHLSAQQKPGGGPGLCQEAVRDRQPEGPDAALLQAGASADMSSTSPPPPSPSL